MTKEEKQLLLKDLCGRLFYGVKVKVFDESILLEGNNEKGTLDGKETMSDDCFVIKCSNDSWIISCEDFKPYLRPMSSMTMVERIELKAITKGAIQTIGLEDIVVTTDKGFDYLNAHHIDYRGLIPMGLALEAPEDMYD